MIYSFLFFQKNSVFAPFLHLSGEQIGEQIRKIKSAHQKWINELTISMF